jgi:hypothetical protein
MYHLWHAPMQPPHWRRARTAGAYPPSISAGGGSFQTGQVTQPSTEYDVPLEVKFFAGVVVWY